MIISGRPVGDVCRSMGFRYLHDIGLHGFSYVEPGKPFRGCVHDLRVVSFANGNRPSLPSRQMKMADKNCWIEVFDDTQYDADDPHVKVESPKEYVSLKNLNARDWYP